VACPLSLACRLLYIFLCERAPQCCMTRAAGASSAATPFPSWEGSKLRVCCQQVVGCSLSKCLSFHLSCHLSAAEVSEHGQHFGQEYDIQLQGRCAIVHLFERHLSFYLHTCIYLYTCMYIPYMRTGNFLSRVKPYRLQASPVERCSAVHC
jgi:hypothetical protein